MLHAVPLHKIEPFYYSLVNRTAVELTWDYNFSLSIRTHRVTIFDLDKLKNYAKYLKLKDINEHNSPIYNECQTQSA